MADVRKCSIASLPLVLRVRGLHWQKRASDRRARWLASWLRPRTFRGLTHDAIPSPGVKDEGRDARDHRSGAARETDYGNGAERVRGGSPIPRLDGFAVSARSGAGHRPSGSRRRGAGSNWLSGRCRQRRRELAMSEMRLDGAEADEQPVGDLLVGRALGGHPRGSKLARAARVAAELRSGVVVAPASSGRGARWPTERSSVGLRGQAGDAFTGESSSTSRRERSSAGAMFVVVPTMQLIFAGGELPSSVRAHGENCV
jgi:hypothetical protein